MGVDAPETGSREPFMNAVAQEEKARERQEGGFSQRLVKQLSGLRRRTAEDPFLNPVELLGVRILDLLEKGELSPPEVDRIIGQLAGEAFERRAARLRAYLGEIDPERNRQRLHEQLRKLLDDDRTATDLRRAGRGVEATWFGFVFTAHPTFGLRPEIEQWLVELALGQDEQGRPLREEVRRRIGERIRSMPHGPDRPLRLEEERQRALQVIFRLQGAIRDMYDMLAGEMARRDPEGWRRVTPRLVSVASWVGYDLDGRADISWTQTLASRLHFQFAQLGQYRQRISSLQKRAREHEIRSLLELIEARLALSEKIMRESFEALDGARIGDPAWLEEFAGVAREIVSSRSLRFTDRRQLAALLERATETATDPELARALWVMRAEVANWGLAAANTHLRLNARQLHNAIRNTIGMEHPPDDPTWRLSYLEAIDRLIEQAQPVTVHFGSILHEQATARRAFMICAQMLKHFDGGEPIRFLIAECETAFTLLTGLYLAKLFGVDRDIDLSPLFETRKALERGARILDEALRHSAFRAYLRRRGRICIQTGFSDAGRYMGQTAASVAIERIRLGLAEVLAEHGLEDLEVVIFDTHGESIGRGGHPESLRERLRYFDTPESRRRFRDRGFHLCEETSFQGADGYRPFLRAESAFAVLCRCLEHALEPPPDEADPFYAQHTYVDEFFASVRQFNGRLIDHPDYAVLLASYGSRLLFPTGSRAVQREQEWARGSVALEHPSQMRAIPHNALLQQLGHLVHVIGGVGQAVARDPEAFEELYAASPRFRSLITMVEHAFKFTDPRVTAGYLALFDAGRWLQLVSARSLAADPEALRGVADEVERMALGERLQRVFRFLFRDYLDLAAALRDHRRRARDAGEAPIAIDPGSRDNLHLLHALRFALLQSLMLRAVALPDFSDRHAVTREELVQRLFRLDVEATLELLEQIFPLDRTGVDEHDYGEPASYTSFARQSYESEHEKLFRPIRRLHAQILQISAGIIHHLGAVG